MVIYYRNHPMNGGLVFAEAAIAEHNSNVHQAVFGSKTWGEFRRTMPSDEFKKVIDWIYEEADFEEVPQDHERFDFSCVPGTEEGDYPEWLQSSMEDRLPKDIMEALKRFGERESTPLNGSYSHVRKENEQEVVEAIRALGHTVERRHDLRFY